MTINIFGKKLEIKTEAVVVIASVLILLGCLIGYFFFSDDSDIIIGSDIEQTADITNKTAQPETGIATASEVTTAVGEASAIEEITPPEMIQVYVVGCIRNPGIVTIEKGGLIDDAVRKAGGLTEDADAANINMVYKLNENTMLYIKSKKELEKETKSEVPLSTSTESRNAGKAIKIIKDSGEGAKVTGSDSQSDTNEASGKAKCVNINTAGADELDALPGIGEATAKDIIAFREANGLFTKIEDIMKVPRIKQGRFDSIKDLITVK